MDELNRGTDRVFTMKQVCERVGMTYEALKFYCNEGLVPNVKRDKNNRRIFDEQDVRWIEDLSCLKRCGMGIREMKEYLGLCLEGPSTIPERMEIVRRKKAALLEEMRELKRSVEYADWKLGFYSDVLEGRIEYRSNLIKG
ncbi:MerR family transcriptional regulator [Raoultibacter timonensis]|uniref:MerR family transcriptional regulator n=1 Tax=Raoultibacter timonensis TaxID=1907662 RepID=UPI0026DBDEE3|nr:MerR family transcriptional regulator [Raoultibacter timonensis]